MQKTRKFIKNDDRTGLCDLLGLRQHIQRGGVKLTVIMDDQGTVPGVILEKRGQGFLEETL